MLIEQGGQYHTESKENCVRRRRHFELRTSVYLKGLNKITQILRHFTWFCGRMEPGVT